MLTLWGVTKWLQWSPWTDLLYVAVLYLGDGLEMAGYSAITQRETLHSHC